MSSNGRLADLWKSFGEHVGQITGRSSEPSGSMVVSDNEESIGDDVFEEIQATINPLEHELEEMVRRFVSRLEKETWRDSGYYVSDVYACESPERAIGLARELSKRAESFKRGFIGISIHNDHVHSIHACPFSNQSCRCSFNKFKEAKEDRRRLLRKPRAIENFTSRDWFNITKYFNTQGRRTTFFKIYDSIQRLPGEIADLSDLILSSQDVGRPDSSLENCNDPLHIHDERERSYIPESIGSSRRRKRRHHIQPGGEGGVLGLTGLILEMLNKYAICPLSEIVHTEEYLQSPCVTKRLDSIEVKCALDTRCSILCNWDLEDYKLFYDNEKTVKIWSSRRLKDFDNYYLSFDESYNIIYSLLSYQMGDLKKDFCATLYNILERRLPKRNCFVVVSPPSAGKNFFFDGIRDYFLNTGQMNNPNKYNQFAYQDCYNRRLIIWNEPNYENRETENLKMLFAGDCLSANVKCKPQANVKRTPVIVLTNVRPHFLNHYAFTDRTVCYQWNSCSMLKDILKKPRPDACIKVLMDIISS